MARIPMATHGTSALSGALAVDQPAMTTTVFPGMVETTIQPTVSFAETTGAGGFFEADLARFDLLGSVFVNPREPRTPSEPAVIAQTTVATSVFNSISVVDQYVVRASQGILRLRETLRHPTSTGEEDETALFRALERYLDEFMTGDAINEVFEGRADELTTYFPNDIEESPDTARPVFRRAAFDDARIRTILNAAEVARPDVLTDRQTLHTQLFEVGRVVLDDSRVVQRLRHALVRLRRVRARELSRRKEAVAELRGEMAAARRRLAALNGARLEALGDAQAAQALLAEDWAAIEAAFEARRRTLEENRGLAFVRVRETPVAVPFADPLPLRPDSGGPFPWEGRIDGDLPEALEPFLETVLEIPVSDWQALSRLTRLLPPPERLGALARLRSARLATRMEAAAPAVRPGVLMQRLAPVGAVARAALADFAARPLAPAASLGARQDAAARVLSLEDLVTGGRHRISGEALALRDALEQAVLGLLGLLREVPAGVRLAWGEAAEADRLAVAQPGRWPALDRAREGDFNTLRSLFEVVEWWFGQLVPRPAPASDAAMRAMMRAVLMLAADDDPAEILQGSVRLAPERLAPGAALRLRLNRRARPGAILQLIDPTNVVVGLLRIDDEDAEGATATVTQALAPAIALNTRFTVLERRLGAWG